MKRSRTFISCPPSFSMSFLFFLCHPAFYHTPAVYLTCIRIHFPRSARLCVHAHQAQMLIHGPLPRPAAHAAYRLPPASAFITAQRSPPQPTHGASRALCLILLVFPPTPLQPTKKKKKIIASCCGRLFMALLLFLFCSLAAAGFYPFTQKTDFSCSPFISWKVG